jgi:hypothetical protein
LTSKERHEFSAANLRPLQGVLVSHAAPRELPVGAEIAARYSADRLMYAARVEGVTTHGYFVVYAGYGNKEEVPAGWVTTDLSSVGSSGVTVPTVGAYAIVGSLAKPPPAPQPKKKRKAAYTTLNADLQKQLRSVPEALKVTAEDSEAQRKRKNRIAKKLKQHNKAVELEMERNNSASSWQKFNMKAQKKKVTGCVEF